MSRVDLLIDVLRDRQRLARFREEDWEAFLVAGEQARLLPRLAIEAQQLGLTSAAPLWAQDRLQAAAVQGKQFEREVRWEIACIQRALRSTGVVPIFLKGAAYVAAALPCGIGRIVADVDILVPERTLPDVESALVAHGWEFEPLDAYDERYYREWMHELPPMRHRGRATMLDVHHRILPRTGRVHPPTERLIAAAVEIDGIRTLAPAHMLLHAAAHLFQDGQIAGALRDVVDLRDLLIEAIGKGGEAHLQAEAVALSLERPLHYAQRYVRKLLGATPVDHRAEAGSAWDALMDRAVVSALKAPPGARTPAALTLLARSHWLKMPAPRLIAHLARRTWRWLVSPTQKSAWPMQ